MVSLARWQTAQQYERGYWESVATRIASGAASQLEWYRWRADQLVARLRRLGLDSVANGSARVVEVGCGPIGVVGFFPARERTAVDPLETFYSADVTLTALRSTSVRYVRGMGEELPCPTGSCDLAIMENCIDHVRDVRAVMRELARVLDDGAVLYVTVNCRTRWGFMMHRLLSRARVDRGHPYTFTPHRMERLLRESGFQVLGIDVGSFSEERKKDLASDERRTRAKGFLGISEFVVSVVARRLPLHVEAGNLPIGDRSHSVLTRQA
jgi:SAM-dependent methyltransferase